VTYHLSLPLAAASRMIAVQATLGGSSTMGAGRPGVNDSGRTLVHTLHRTPGTAQRHH